MSVNVFVCPYCGEADNLSKNEGINRSTCNVCDGLLLPKVPVDVNERIFKRFISHSTLPVVVNFWGAWSGKSQEMAEVVASLAHTFQTDAVFLRVNCEQEQVLANSYKLIDIPTFILFKSQAEYRRIQGALSERDFHAWLERYLRVKRKKATYHRSSV
jgi:thioredoxin 2